MEPLRTLLINSIRRFSLILMMVVGACTNQASTSNHYLTAEKLWTEKNYLAAVSEFDHVVKESPDTAVGLQSLWRASMTRTLFLNQPELALKGFETFLERAGNSELAPQALQEIGEIYFSKQALYGKSIEFYSKLLLNKKFSDEEKAKFIYRIARSNFLIHKVPLAISWFEKLNSQYPTSPYRDRADYDLANAWYSLGDVDRSAFPKALKIFQDLATRIKSKNHTLYVESVFGEAVTLEELDQFEEAYALLKEIQNDYPAPNIIKIRMKSIEERKKKKRK